MSDAIDRQAAIDAVTNHCIAVLESHTYDSITTDVYEMAHRHIIDVLRVFPSAQPERWIPCSERLPEDYTDVLVWFEYFRYGNYNCLYQMYGIGSYSSQYDSWLINQETGWNELKVFAWMPLPEPYKGEQK